MNFFGCHSDQPHQFPTRRKAQEKPNRIARSRCLQSGFWLLETKIMGNLDESRRFYVYAHLKPNGGIFYVGKGCGNRLNRKDHRSQLWWDIANKYGFIAIKILENLTEAEAFQQEAALIAQYKSKGYGLVNAIWKGMFVPTGKENRTYKDVISKEDLHTLYIQQNLSSIQIAEITGVSYATVTARLKEYGLKARNPGRKKIRIRCVSDGNEFDSITEAAKFYGVYRENICKVLNGIYSHTGKLRFTYAEK